MTASSSGTMDWQHGRHPPPYSYDSPYGQEYPRGAPSYNSTYQTGPPINHYPHSQRGPPPLPPHPHSRPDYWGAYEGMPRRHWNHGDSNRSQFEPPFPPSLPPMTHSGPPPHYNRPQPARPPTYYDRNTSSYTSSETYSVHTQGELPRSRLDPREPKAREGGEATYEASGRGGQRNEREQPEDSRQEKRDPLSLLAKVSTAMAPPKNRGEHMEREDKDVSQPDTAPPTSPLQRRLRASPIVPSSKKPQTGPPDSAPRTPKPITPNASRTPHQPYEEYHHGPPPPRGAYPYGAQPPPYSRHYSQYREWESQYPPHGAPAVVERNSFDSESSAASSPDPRRYYIPYPPTPDSADYHSPPAAWHPRYRGNYPQWSYEGGSPPPRYPPPHFPPHPHYRGYEDADGYGQEAHRSPPDRPPPPYGPYSYVQQPSMEQKTLLRKKFSWKHYPELERFLIENRDEYLKHSSRNYTVEQKQFNNMLTEKLLEVAEKYCYVFDPDDFNFVAIRDRIRCYYKSFVQTARKRGLLLPTDLERDEKKTKGDDEMDERAEEGDEVDGISNEGVEAVRSAGAAAE